MEADNSSAIRGQHSMGQLMLEHHTALSSISTASLVLGAPLAVHMLWHLQASLALISFHLPVVVWKYFANGNKYNLNGYIGL